MSPDPFGIGEAIQHGLRMLLHGQRRSGRDTALVDMVQEGDLILVAMTPVKYHMQALLRDKQFKDVDVAVIDPRSTHEIIDKTHATKRRVLFHHSIYEAYYSYAMDYAMTGMERTREFLDERYEENRPKSIQERLERSVTGELSIKGGPYDR